MRGRGGGDRDVEDDFEREDVGVREEDLGEGDLREGGGDIGGGGDLREGGKDIGGGGDL